VTFSLQQVLKTTRKSQSLASFPLLKRVKLIIFHRLRL